MGGWLKDARCAGWAMRLLVGVVGLSGLGAGTIPDTGLARLEAAALLATLDADLLSHDSATVTLGRWCEAHRLADSDRIRAVRVSGPDQPASAAVRHDLGVGADEPVRFRRVRLSCGGLVLSEADNWYVPRLLTPVMNRALDETDTPFGRVVMGLGFTRHTLEAETLWRPLAAGWEMTGLPADRAGRVTIPGAILRHRAVLARRDGVAFSEVIETYQGAMLGFAWPGGGD